MSTKTKEDNCSKLLQKARYFNNFYFNGYKNGTCKPLYCHRVHVGLVEATVEAALRPFKEVFSIADDKIEICPGITDSNEITEKVDKVLRSLRETNNFVALKGWRDEKYDIRGSAFGDEPLFQMERSATSASIYHFKI